MKERLVNNPDGSQGRLFALDIAEVKRLCRPGAGADTCIWLVAGVDGFECLYYNRQAVNLVGESLEDRWKKGLTVAKRDGMAAMRLNSMTILERRNQWLSI